MIKSIDTLDTDYSKISDYALAYGKLLPNKEALVYGSERITYSQLSSKVKACSKALIAFGIVKGDRVAMLCAPSAEFYIVFLATVNIGAIWVGLNPKYTLNEFSHTIEDAKPKILFSMLEFSNRDYSKELKYLYSHYDCLEHLVVVGKAQVPYLSFTDFLACKQTIPKVDYHAVISSVSSLDPALIVYTSGSSGKPKGAVLSHHGLCFGATVQAEHFDVQEPSIICNMPINHVACIADICCTTLVKGGTICFQKSFDPQSMLEALEKEKIKIWAGVPTMFLLQLEQANFISYDFTKLQLILWGGAAMPESAISQLRTLGVPMMTLYGMTETSAHTIYSDKRASLWSLRDNIGRPDIRMPCRIVNELSIECPVGVQGELQFRGDYLMLGYYNNPNATLAAYTDDGWFRSGDIGLWLDSGEISLVGRISDMYKSGGYNIYPREIELLLESHPSVGASVVVSIPDPIFQEVSIAFIIGKHQQNIDIAEVTSFCKNHLANYKLPKKFINIAQFPMLPIGKVDKIQLKQMGVDSV
jgi:acyl-CoA synthetase (AMP-forming)/AMP-acid ligase II